MKKLIVLLLMLSFAGHAGRVEASDACLMESNSVVSTELGQQSMTTIKEMLSDLIQNAPEEQARFKLEAEENSLEFVINTLDVRFVLKFTQVNRYDVTVSVEKGTRFGKEPIENTISLCREDSDYCPTLEANMYSWATGGQANSLNIVLEATSKYDPDDSTYGLQLIYRAGIDGGKPVFSIQAWDEDEDSDDTYFYIQSN